MKKLAIFYILFFGVTTYVFPQSSFPKTNNWIDYDQPYFKLAVIENGIHRVSKEALKSKGVPVTTISNDLYRIFEHGKEIPINVTADYIEFYGERTNAEIDKLLYEKEEDQMVRYQTLYTDTAYYYLTYGSSVKGLRYQPVTNTNTTGLNKVQSHSKTVNITYNELYSNGTNDKNDDILPKYAKGEGWGSAVLVSGRGGLVEEFNISDKVPDSSVYIRTTIVGQNDRGEPFIKDGHNQHFAIDYDDNGWRPLTRKLFTGRLSFLVEAELKNSDFNSPNLKLNLFQDQYYLGQRNSFRARSTCQELVVSYSAKTDVLGADYKVFNLAANTSDQHLLITNVSSSNSVVYDVDNAIAYNFTRQGSDVSIRLKQSSKQRRIVIQKPSSIKEVIPRRVKLEQSIQSTTANFIIITSKRFSNEVLEYVNYKESVAGGSFDVDVAYVENLYNEYYYGYHHPLSIKSYLNELIKTNNNVTDVLFIGKGVSVGFLRQDGIFDYSLDIVPSIGNPCSDWYYGFNLTPNHISAPFGIGRLSVTKASEITNYLNKLKAYNTLENAKWRKDVLHVSGGKDESEQTRFANYMKLLGETIDKEKMGANITYLGKESGLEIDGDLKDKITKNINDGIGLYSYFGHAALNVAEVDIGEPLDYNNGNSPVPMYFAGCVLGGCFEEGYSLGEEFVNEPTGAIAWVASSNFSFETTVLDFTRVFYSKLGGSSYGKSIGSIFSSTIDSFYRELDPYRQAQCWQTIVQGDPSIKLYSPEKADFEITKNDIFLDGSEITAQTDSFKINVVVKNLGRAIGDSIQFYYNVIGPNGSSQSDTVTIPPVHNTDTLSFTYFNSNNEFGSFKCEFKVESEDKISEIRESNNSTTYDFALVSNGSVGLFPLNYGIVSDQKTELIGQSLSNTTKLNIFQFEIDTVPTFKSPWRKQSGDLNGDLIKSWPVNLLEKDSQSYYWRIRLKLENNVFSPWSKSSFSRIENSLSGWAQINFNQISNSNFTDIYADSATRTYQYYRVTAPGQVSLRNHGRNFPYEGYYVFGEPLAFNDAKVIRLNDYSQLSGGSSYNGMIAHAFAPTLNENNTFTIYTKDYGVPISGKGEYQFDWMKSETEIDPVVLDSFISFLNNIPNGYHIVMYSGYYHRIGDMPERFYQAVESFGSSQIRRIGNNAVWVFSGTKGTAIGMAQDERFSNKQDTMLESTSTYTVVKFRGNIRSQIIGPSKKWRRLSLGTIGINTDDKLIDNSYNLIGITQEGKKTILVEQFKQKNLDLSFIDPTQYPFLQLELNCYNKRKFMPAKPLSWVVNYDYLPEGLINTELALKFNSDTLQQGEPLVFEVGYQNVSNLSLENVPVSYEILNKNREVKISIKDTIPPLGPGEGTVLKTQFVSDDLLNENRLVVKTNSGFVVPELYSFNNNFERSFYVKGDLERPFLEVTFDGNRILDGDIVSPSPNIVITGIDNNNFFPLDDPSFFDVYIESSDSSSPQKIDQLSKNYTFKPASVEKPKARIEYSPKKLADGNYTLSVQLKDASGNTSGTSAYKVSFQVIGKSSISNFYAYPNPFSTQMKFVFTLTGDQIPDDIVIQILTISGKVVREIHKDELGSLKIGNNTSNFTWDGTDTYGNRLANGVYIYRVKTVINGLQVEHRSTSGDEAFKENFGKIYILR